MNDYQNAPACKLLATNCVCCGKPLVDAISVQEGVGPECRNHMNGEHTEVARKEANVLIFEAALAAQKGKVEAVKDYADKLDALGFVEVAKRIRERFTFSSVKALNPDIIIIAEGSVLKVKTPYRRRDTEAFLAAWRHIPGRSWERGSKYNVVPVKQKEAVWFLLRKFFPGKWGKGPKGMFKVPALPKEDRLLAQPELG